MWIAGSTAGTIVRGNTFANGTGGGLSLATDTTSGGSTVECNLFESISGIGLWVNSADNVIRLNGGIVQQGDSGSAIVATNDNNVVGLVFANNNLNQGYGCMIL